MDPKIRKMLAEDTKRRTEENALKAEAEQKKRERERAQMIKAMQRRNR